MSSHRFDLEKAIAAWRRPFEHDRTFSPEDLEELESSLRDRFEAYVEKGLSREVAFREALRHMGSYGTAETEYRKVYWSKLRKQRQLGSELTWRFSMLTNYLKIAWRNLRKHKGYSFINITGLAVGLACSFFILLWVQDELSVDRFLEGGDRIYRVWRNVDIDGQMHTLHPTPRPLGEALAGTYPEIEALTHMSWEQQMIVTYGDQSFREEANYAGEDFFRVFPFPFLWPSPVSVEKEKSTILSEKEVTLCKYEKTILKSSNEKPLAWLRRTALHRPHVISAYM